MDKHTLLQELQRRINAGEISREEVLHRIGTPPPHATHPATDSATPFQFSVTKALYILGGAIVSIGLIFFTAQIWDDIGSLGRIFVTLGLGFIVTALGAVLSKTKPGDLLGPVFFVIGGLLIPGGALVTLSELSTGVVSVWPVAITFGVIFAFYLAMNQVHRSAVLTFFAIGNGTAFVYLLVSAWLDPSEDFYSYLTIIIGVSYILLARQFAKNWNRALTGVLHVVGTAAVYIAAFTQVTDHTAWHFLYVLLIVGGYYAAVFLRSRSMLALGTVALLAHISYITSEYFADSLGWPLSLVILGFVMIGLGAASVSMGRKYIAKS